MRRTVSGARRRRARAKMLRFAILALCVTCFAAVGFCMDSGWEKRRFSSMHAVVELIIPSESGSGIPPVELADRAEVAVRNLNDLLGPKGERSDVRRLNDAAPGEWVAVDPLTIRVVVEAKRWHVMTEGLFDPTIGPLKRLFRFDNAALVQWPSEQALDEARTRVGADKLLVDEEGMRLSWAAPGMYLDLGGIAKGFAADVAADILLGAGVENALISVGGEMRILGSKPGSPPEPWEIGLTDPRGKGMTYAASVTSRALASSGDYESFFEYEGRRYSHILDPRSGLPLPEKVAGATVSHPASATCADALATVMCILGSERGARFLEMNWREAGLAGTDIVLFEILGGGSVEVVRLSVDDGGAVTVTRP